MIYTFLITIVFLAEVVIAITVIQALLKLDKKVQEYDEIITLAKPTIIDIVELARKVSEQYIKLTKQNIEKIHKSSEEYALNKLFKISIGLLFIKSNIKIIQKIRKSKLLKTIAKGLSILENMV